jgi:hypothetical protein
MAKKEIDKSVQEQFVFSRYLRPQWNVFGLTVVPEYIQKSFSGDD